MTSIAHAASKPVWPRPVWKRVFGWFTAFAEAAEMDSAMFTHQRIQRLELRLANLERKLAHGTSTSTSGEA